MIHAENHREHSNLYYILKADQQANPMPAERVELLRTLFLELFLQNIKPMEHGKPPC